MKRKAIERHHKDYGGRGGWTGEMDPRDIQSIYLREFYSRLNEESKERESMTTMNA